MRIPKGKMILAKDFYCDLDDVATGLNNNVVGIGSPGSGKTRSLVAPNILQAYGSYIVTDPKGNLYDKYNEYLKNKGYEVKRLDFVNPDKSVRYNPLAYVKSDQDIMRLATVLASPQLSSHYQTKMDPYWEQNAGLILAAAISYLKERVKPEEQTLQNVFNLLSLVESDLDSTGKSKLSRIFERYEKVTKAIEEEIPFSVKQYNKVKTAPPKTFSCILSTVFADLGMLDTKQMKKMMSGDDIDIPSIGKKKTAVFVVISDTDRSLDKLANTFYTQAMNELCLFADTECKNNRLPVDVRFILDDFATNCKIDEFPRMISSIRSRGISSMLILQSESQLMNAYGFDGKTILGCCDTYVYLGGNDLETVRSVSERCDEPPKKILNLPIGECVIMRRGEESVHAEVFPLESFSAYQKAMDMQRSDDTPKICVEERKVNRLSFKESTTLNRGLRENEKQDMFASNDYL